MTDEKKIIKEAIDDIKPDVYMKTRLQAKIKEQGVREAAKEITQLTDEKLLDAIVAEYEKLA